MKQIRPVFLDLTKIHFPVTAIVSILHRISGFLIFLLIPFILWLADMAATPTGFTKLETCFDVGFVGVITRLLVWGFLAAILYHLLAGIKHLLMDIHWMKENLSTARQASIWVISLAIIFIILAGIWLW